MCSRRSSLQGNIRVAAYLSVRRCPAATFARCQKRGQVSWGKDYRYRGHSGSGTRQKVIARDEPTQLVATSDGCPRNYGAASIRRPSNANLRAKKAAPPSKAAAIVKNSTAKKPKNAPDMRKVRYPVSVLRRARKRRRLDSPSWRVGWRSSC